MENAQFLSKKYNNLHTSPEVASAAQRTEKQTGEKVPQSPEKKIQNYLDRFSEVLNREDPEERQQGIAALKKVLHKELIIKDENINYEYLIKQQQRIAEDEGRPFDRNDIDGQTLDQFRSIKKESIISGQKHSLNEWIDYLSSPDAMYPDWAKYWAFRSMTQMGGYIKKEGRFSRRTQDSTQPFPTLNIGSLAKTISFVQEAAHIDRLPKDSPKRKEIDERLEHVIKSIHTLPEDFDDREPEEQERLITKQGENEASLRKLLSSENFSKIYTHLLESRGEFSQEQLETIAGYWKTYEQGSSANELYESLQGYPLEWCTAENYSTAQEQLEGGDFHVYYSENAKGKTVIPRLAIRMEGKDKIAENPRGIEAKQNIDQYIQPVLDEKIKAFGQEGKRFMKKSEDMKRMTDITKKHRTGQELSKEDLRFIYELDGEIEGFGYQRDPRIEETIAQRDQRKDLADVLNYRPEQIALTQEEALAGDYMYFSGNIDLDSLSSAEGLSLPEQIGGGLDLRGLSSAEGLSLPEQIGGGLYLDRLSSADKDILREKYPQHADKI